MPGLRPSTRPTSADTVAVLGNAGSIQLTPVSLSHAQVTVLDVLARAELGRAAAPEGAAEAPRAGRELGEELEHPGDGPRVRAAAAVRGGRHEVLAHREVREHLAALGHEADPDLGDAVRREPVDRPAVEADRAGPRPPDAHDRADRRRLPPALPAHPRPPPPPLSRAP